MMSAAKTDQDEHNIDQEWNHQLEDDITDLGLLETEHIERIATRWNVEIPSDAWIENLYDTASYIGPPAQRKLWREIQTTKREWIRFTVQAVVMPLIAVLSLAVALFALWTRKPN